MPFIPSLVCYHSIGTFCCISTINFPLDDMYSVQCTVYNVT